MWPGAERVLPGIRSQPRPFPHAPIPNQVTTTYHHICKHKACSKPFQTTNKQQLYCQPKCRKAAHRGRIRVVLPPRNCNQCGELFQPKYKNSKWCSEACYRLDLNKARREAWARRKKLRQTPAHLLKPSDFDSLDDFLARHRPSWRDRKPLSPKGQWRDNPWQEEWDAKYGGKGESTRKCELCDAIVIGTTRLCADAPFDRLCLACREEVGACP